MISEVHTQTGLSVLIETLIYNMYKDTGQAFIFLSGRSYFYMTLYSAAGLHSFQTI